VKALSRDLNDLLRVDLDEAALDRLEWRDFGKGVRLAKLARDGKAGLVLYRIAADAPRDGFAPHLHVGGEAYLVLKGMIADSTGRYPRGSFVWLPKGSKHAPWAEGDTVVLVLWPEGVEVDGG
jgi:anti-sigma factor ChrR (cupin superfamily)